MSDDKEKQYLTDIVKAIESPSANDWKMNIIISVVAVIGVGAYLAAYFLSKSARI